MALRNYFQPAELQCKCCGQAHMNAAFLAKLNALRGEAGFPFFITSGYRCAVHNKHVGGAGNSFHLVGRAVDINLRHAQAIQVITLARFFGLNGIGVAQKGNNRFIHLDDRDTPALWSY